LVKAIGAGNADITVETIDGGFTATCTVIVDDIPTTIPEAIQNDKQSVSVFPNPVENGFIYINPGSMTGSFMVKLFDLQGRVNFEAETTSRNNSINISTLNKGMYILMINTDTESFTQKLTIK